MDSHGTSSSRATPLSVVASASPSPMAFSPLHQAASRLPLASTPVRSDHHVHFSLESELLAYSSDSPGSEVDSASELDYTLPSEDESRPGLDQVPMDFDVPPVPSLPATLVPLIPSDTVIRPQSATAGYKIVFDNIDKTVRPRYMTYTSQTQSLNYVQAYAVKDRVDYSCLP